MRSTAAHAATEQRFRSEKISEVSRRVSGTRPRGGPKQHRVYKYANIQNRTYIIKASKLISNNKCHLLFLNIYMLSIILRYMIINSH